MRVRMVKRSTLREFCNKHPDSEAGFDDWCEKVREANWLIPSDILKVFTTADLLGNGSSRVIFNIGGNHYRMICKYQFEGRRVRLYIKWIGTHAEYSKLCKKGLQYSVNNY